MNGPSTRRFACAACGKCCTTPPAMGIVEAILINGPFVLFASLRPSLKSAADSRLNTINPPGAVTTLDGDYYETLAKYLKGQNKEFKDIYPIIRSSNKRAEYFLVFTAFHEPFQGADQAPCPALNGNLCSIYDQRPAACRSLPFNDFTPPGFETKSFDSFIRHAREHDWPCQTAPVDAPIIIDRDEIVDPEYLDALALCAINRQNDRGPVNTLSEHLPDLSEALEKICAGQATQITIDSMHTLAMLAFMDNKITEEQALAFANRQIDLIDEAVANALERKNPGDRPYTARLRTQKTHYQKIIPAFKNPEILKQRELNMRHTTA